MPVRIFALALVVAQGVPRGKRIFDGYFEHDPPEARVNTGCDRADSKIYCTRWRAIALDSLDARNVALPIGSVRQRSVMRRNSYALTLGALVAWGLGCVPGYR